MSLNKKKHGFTLAEVMVVLLVLTLLLAVFAPLITKRRKPQKGEELWRWATRNYLAGPMDAYFNPTDQNDASLFIGMSPDSPTEINENYEPLGKIIIRAGLVGNGVMQRHIQFRQGRTNYEDIGHFAGSLLMDNSNILLGGTYSNMVPKVSNTTYPTNNIAIGFKALDEIGDRGNETNTDPALNNIAFGFNSSQQLVSGDNNISIGAGAGLSNVSASNNIMIGHNTGFKTTTSNNTLVGYQANAGNQGDSQHNVLIGSQSGQQTNFELGDNTYAKNTGIGYNVLSKIATGNNNIAIGSGALKNLERGNYNVAIGYNACANLVNQSHKTCIGYNSGPAANSSASADIAMGIDDNAERTYIGTNDNKVDVPNTSRYGGDAVLEIHNIAGPNTGLINNPGVKSNTTTIINGNLVVMGKTFLTIGNILYPFSYSDNIFGAEYSSPCSENQTGYNFSTDNCSELINLTGTSDRRLKNINSNFAGGLSEINQIKVHSFTFKNDKKKKRHTGVIAQELRKIFPNSVSEDENGYLKIRWDEMFYASINAIKELNHKIVSLIKETTNLEKQIQKLEEENKDLNEKTDALSKRVEALKNK